MMMRGNHQQDVTNELRTSLMNFWGNSGREMGIKFICVQRVKSEIGGPKEQFIDRPRKNLTHKNAGADTQEQWRRPCQDGATKGRNRECRREKGRRY
jgi:hypothetical protein